MRDDLDGLTVAFGAVVLLIASVLFIPAAPVNNHELAAVAAMLFLWIGVLDWKHGRRP